MEDCIFCKIVKGETPTEIEKETERVLVFAEARPTAPIHLLVVPKQHIRDVRELESYTWEDIKKIISELVDERKIDGFRLTTYGGKSELVPHMAFHFMAGMPESKQG